MSENSESSYFACILIHTHLHRVSVNTMAVLADALTAHIQAAATVVSTVMDHVASKETTGLCTLRKELVN